MWGGAMQCGANNYATLLIGRILGGIAIGCVPSHLLLLVIYLANT